MLVSMIKCLKVIWPLSPTFPNIKMAQSSRSDKAMIYWDWLVCDPNIHW